MQPGSPGESVKGFPVIASFLAADGKSRIALHVPVLCGMLGVGSIDQPVYDHRMRHVFDEMEQSGTCNAFLLLSYHSLSLLRQEARDELDRILPPAWRDTTEGSFRNLREWCIKSLIYIGVQHNNLYPRNMLWCNKLKAIVLIDFEDAEVFRTSHTSRFYRQTSG